MTVLILTYNEAQNISTALDSVVPHFEQIIIVDSFSSDQTVEICKRYPSVMVYQNAFQDWAQQRNWMLANCEIKHDTVFFLDADEYVTKEFTAELRDIIRSNVDFSSAFVKPKFIFLNKPLNHAYGHPKIRRIFKSKGLTFFCEGARERAVSDGPVVEIKAPLMHHDRKPIADWVSKHNRNAVREATFFLSGSPPSVSGRLPFSLKVRSFIRERIWNRMPLLIRPFFYFIYRYVFKLGLLDGRAGLIYCYLHAFWYQSLIDIMIIERKNDRKCQSST